MEASGSTTADARGSSDGKDVPAPTGVAETQPIRMPQPGAVWSPTAKSVAIERWSLADDRRDTDVPPEALVNTLEMAMAHMLTDPSALASACGSCLAYDSGAQTGPGTPPEGYVAESSVSMPPAPRSSSSLDLAALDTGNNTPSSTSSRSDAHGGAAIDYAE